MRFPTLPRLKARVRRALVKHTRDGNIRCDAYSRVTHVTHATDLDADYIVVEVAKKLLGPDWLTEYVRRANTGGIERVLV